MIFLLSLASDKICDIDPPAITSNTTNKNANLDIFLLKLLAKFIILNNTFFIF